MDTTSIEKKILVFAAVAFLAAFISFLFICPTYKSYIVSIVSMFGYVASGATFVLFYFQLKKMDQDRRQQMELVEIPHKPRFYVGDLSLFLETLNTVEGKKIRAFMKRESLSTPEVSLLNNGFADAVNVTVKWEYENNDVIKIIGGEDLNFEKIDLVQKIDSNGSFIKIVNPIKVNESHPVNIPIYFLKCCASEFNVFFDGSGKPSGDTRKPQLKLVIKFETKFGEREQKFWCLVDAVKMCVTMKFVAIDDFLSNISYQQARKKYGQEILANPHFYLGARKA